MTKAERKRRRRAANKRLAVAQVVRNAQDPKVAKAAQKLTPAKATSMSDNKVDSEQAEMFSAYKWIKGRFWGGLGGIICTLIATTWWVSSQVATVQTEVKNFSKSDEDRSNDVKEVKKDGKERDLAIHRLEINDAAQSKDLLYLKDASVETNKALDKLTLIVTEAMKGVPKVAVVEHSSPPLADRLMTVRAGAGAALTHAEAPGDGAPSFEQMLPLRLTRSEVKVTIDPKHHEEADVELLPGGLDKDEAEALKRYKAGARGVVYLGSTPPPANGERVGTASLMPQLKIRLATDVPVLKGLCRGIGEDLTGDVDRDVKLLVVFPADAVGVK